MPSDDYSFDGSPALKLTCVFSETRKHGDVGVHMRAWHGGYAVTQYTVGLVVRERFINGVLNRREMFARHGMASDALVREALALSDEWFNMADLGGES